MCAEDLLVPSPLQSTYGKGMHRLKSTDKPLTAGKEGLNVLFGSEFLLKDCAKSTEKL